MKSFSRAGVNVAHINSFQFNKLTPSIFYGILRGSGMAMRYQKFQGIDFHYLDNGYFDAMYMDKNKIKTMDGKYRIVKNDLIEAAPVDPEKTIVGIPRVLFLPPSPYTAFMHDTTPEDWNIRWGNRAVSMQIPFNIRHKESDKSLEEDLKDFDAVLAFNSIGVMKAIELGKAVYTTHGVIRNSHLFGLSVPYYDLDKLKEFYEPKQFTLEQIESLGVKCLN